MFVVTFEKYGDYEEMAVIVPNGQQLIDDLDCVVKSLTNKSLKNQYQYESERNMPSKS